MASNQNLVVKDMGESLEVSNLVSEKDRAAKVPDINCCILKESHPFAFQGCDLLNVQQEMHVGDFCREDLHLPLGLRCRIQDSLGSPYLIDLVAV